MPPEDEVINPISRTKFRILQRADISNKSLEIHRVNTF